MRVQLALTVVLLDAAVWFGVTPALAQDEGQVAMIVELLNESDREFRSLAFEQIRTALPGEVATKAFAGQLSKLPADAQVGLIGALADRGDAAAREAILALLASTDDPDVRVAAVRSVGALGKPEDVPQMVTLLASDDEALNNAARASLVRLAGDDSVDAMVAAMSKAEVATQVALIEILAERRALTKISLLLELAVGNDDQLRTAAMTALGEVGEAAHLPGMLRGVLAASPGVERDAAEKNVMFVCQRMTDEQQRTQALTDAVASIDESDRIALLSTLGRVGGTAALAEVDRAIASRDDSVHGAGFTALANWPDASAAPRLIELATEDRHEAHRIAAIRALIRIAPLPDGRTDAEKLELLKTAMNMTTRDTERLLALKRAAAIRIPESLRFVLPYVDQSKFRDQACETIVELAHHRELREANKAEFHAALDHVMSVSKNATVIDRARRYKNNQTWVRPK